MNQHLRKTIQTSSLTSIHNSSVLIILDNVKGPGKYPPTRCKSYFFSKTYRMKRHVQALCTLNHLRGWTQTHLVSGHRSRCYDRPRWRRYSLSQSADTAKCDQSKTIGRHIRRNTERYLNHIAWQFSTTQSLIFSHRPDTAETCSTQGLAWKQRKNQEWKALDSDRDRWRTDWFRWQFWRC